MEKQCSGMEKHVMCLNHVALVIQIAINHINFASKGETPINGHAIRSATLK